MIRVVVFIILEVAANVQCETESTGYDQSVVHGIAANIGYPPTVLKVVIKGDIQPEEIEKLLNLCVIEDKVVNDSELIRNRRNAITDYIEKLYSYNNLFRPYRSIFRELKRTQTTKTPWLKKLLGIRNEPTTEGFWGIALGAHTFSPFRQTKVPHHRFKNQQKIDSLLGITRNDYSTPRNEEGHYQWRKKKKKFNIFGHVKIEATTPGIYANATFRRPYHQRPLDVAGLKTVRFNKMTPPKGPRFCEKPCIGELEEIGGGTWKPPRFGSGTATPEKLVDYPWSTRTFESDRSIPESESDSFTTESESDSSITDYDSDSSINDYESDSSITDCESDTTTSDDYWNILENETPTEEYDDEVCTCTVESEEEYIGKRRKAGDSVGVKDRVANPRHHYHYKTHKTKPPKLKITRPPAPKDNVPPPTVAVWTMPPNYVLDTPDPDKVRRPPPPSTPPTPSTTTPSTPLTTTPPTPSTTTPPIPSTTSPPEQATHEVETKSTEEITTKRNTLPPKRVTHKFRTKSRTPTIKRPPPSTSTIKPTRTCGHRQRTGNDENVMCIPLPIPTRTKPHCPARPKCPRRRPTKFHRKPQRKTTAKKTCATTADQKCGTDAREKSAQSTPESIPLSVGIPINDDNDRQGKPQKIIVRISSELGEVPVVIMRDNGVSGVSLSLVDDYLLNENNTLIKCVNKKPLRGQANTQIKSQRAQNSKMMKSSRLFPHIIRYQMNGLQPKQHRFQISYKPNPRPIPVPSGMDSNLTPNLALPQDAFAESNSFPNYKVDSPQSDSFPLQYPEIPKRYEPFKMEPTLVSIGPEVLPLPEPGYSLSISPAHYSRFQLNPRLGRLSLTQLEQPRVNLPRSFHTQLSDRQMMDRPPYLPMYYPHHNDDPLKYLFSRLP